MADITFTGNVGSADLRFTPNGKAVLSLSVAENHRKNQGGEWIDDGTTWWRVTVWGRDAETLAEHAPKGTRVVVAGQARSRDWEKDGEKRTTYEVNARHVGIVPKLDTHGGGFQRQPQPTDVWGGDDASAPF